MHPYENVLAVADLTAHQRDVLDAVQDRVVADRPELTVLGRDAGLRDAHHLRLDATAVGHHVGDRDEREPVLGGERLQLLQPGHVALVLLRHHLAEHPGRTQAGHPGQVDGGLGVPRAAQHAALAGTQRYDVAGAGEVGRRGVGRGEQPDRAGAVGRRDAGADPLTCVDGDRVGRAALVLVGVEHRRQVEPVAVRVLHGDADVARGVADHERHELGRRQLGGEDEVALVLAVLVVDDDDDLAGGDVGDGPLDAVQPGHLAVRRS